MEEKKNAELSKKAKDAISGVGSKVGKAFHNAKEQAAPVAGKIAHQISDTSKNVANTIQNKASDIKQEIGKKREESANVPITEDAAEGLAPVKTISTRNAIKIIYYLMAADGEIFHSEEEKFDAIGASLDPNFPDKKDQIVSECREQIDKMFDPEDYYDVLQEGVEIALETSVQTEDSFITPKLLVWDLLTIAYSDENYDDKERRLLKYVVRKLDIDKAVFLEMESSILTLVDMERETAWLKTTDRPYLTIEAMVNEIADRKNVIFESVKDLISL